MTSNKRCWPASRARASSVSGSCPARCAESRRPRAVFGLPVTCAASWSGSEDSDIAAMTFEALGASTKAIPGGSALGGVDAVEQQLGSVVGNRYHYDLPHVTVDLALWPRPVILFANKARFESLSVEQQTALRESTKQLVASTTAAVEAEDASAVATLCADGSDIVVAGTGRRSRADDRRQARLRRAGEGRQDGVDDQADRRHEGRDHSRGIDHLVSKPIGLTGPTDRRRLPGRHLRSATFVRRARGLLGGPPGTAAEGPVPLSGGDGLHPEGQHVRRELRRALEVQLLRRPYPARQLHPALVVGWQAADLQRDPGRRRR